MPKVDAYQHGEPCWADLQTPDVEAAKNFYSGVFGWTYRDFPTPDGRSYSQAFTDGELVSVIAPQNPSQQAAGDPARWNVYFAATDAASLMQDAVHAGGTAEFGPEDVGDTGVLAFLAPPGGGTTGIWQAGNPSWEQPVQLARRPVLGGTVHAQTPGRRRLLPGTVRA